MTDDYDDARADDRQARGVKDCVVCGLPIVPAAEWYDGASFRRDDKWMHDPVSLGEESAEQNGDHTARPVLERCFAVLHHGPGHQSKTFCRLLGDHEIHEAVYGDDTVAHWRNGSYKNELIAREIPVPSWVNDGTAMTGFFDEPPDERSN